MANILVCDDDKDIVEAISIYLEQEGYTVLKAYDGVEAINALRSQSVDLLIIDIMMPKLDGIRATLKIREENPLPIIILSAKSEDADKILGLNVGADDYVTKPFNLFHNGSGICKSAGNADIQVHSLIRNGKFLDSFFSTDTAFCDLVHGFFAVVRDNTYISTCLVSNFL